MNEEEELSRLERLAKSTMDYILNSLERRALSWKNKKYYKYEKCYLYDYK